MVVSEWTYVRNENDCEYCLLLFPLYSVHGLVMNLIEIFDSMQSINNIILIISMQTLIDTAISSSAINLLSFVDKNYLTFSILLKSSQNVTAGFSASLHERSGKDEKIPINKKNIVNQVKTLFYLGWILFFGSNIWCGLSAGNQLPKLLWNIIKY